MASLFAESEKEFGSLLVDVSKRAASLPELTGDAKQASLEAGHREIDELLELLEQMEVDVMDVDAEARVAAKKRLVSYKTQLSDAQAKLKRGAVAMSSGQAARDELFADAGASEDSRAALLSNTERLDRTSTRLQDGHRTAMETQEVAIGIMDDLHAQRDTIQRSRGRLRGMDSELSTSNRILNGMIARARRNKVVTFLIIVIALGLIGGMIYLIAAG